MVQRRDAPDHTWFIGKGKAEELRELCLAVDADTVVFDNELSPGPAVQPREAARAHGDRPHRGDPRHLRPERPHARGQGAGRAGAAALPPAPAAPRGRPPSCRSSAAASAPASAAARPSSRSTGGGSCAASDASSPSSRSWRATATLQRKSRDRSGLAAVTIVGYTNAGKSTLLNRLTDAGVLTEDRLFATLDPTTRRLALPGGEPVLLTDTVGFVRRLPHGLVESFKSTLEVAAAPTTWCTSSTPSAPDPDGQIAAVHEVLAEIDAGAVPELLVFNKADLAPAEAKQLVVDHPGSVAVSAAHRGGHRRLPARARRPAARAHHTVVELLVPYDRGDVLAAIHREGEVVSTTDEAGAMRVGPGCRTPRPAGSPSSSSPTG